MNTSMTPRLIILGAGAAGSRVARELRDRHYMEFTVLGFLDDDPAKLGTRIEGLPVLAELKRIESIVEEFRVDTLLLAIPSLRRDERDTLLRRARQTGARVRSLPALHELLMGDTPDWLHGLQTLDHREFLNRPAIHTGIEPPDITREDILVTGAAGTIGSELCRYLLEMQPRKLYVLDCAETPLYLVYRELEAQLAHLHSSTELIPVFCDLTWPVNVANTMRDYKPSMIFHAAAYKHVPACEWSPSLAVRINLLATWHLLALACHYHVRHFTLISTDKAVAPTTILGMTKRLAEYALYEQAACCPHTQFNAVRFGNVLGSNGSVIPLFQAQINRGGPVTVTHPDITRYFMTVQEAVMLVVQAAYQPGHGTLSILDMGDPVKIVDLAVRLIERRGYRPVLCHAGLPATLDPRSIPILFTGLRPGEKLHEGLWDADEELTRSSHPKILHARRRTGASPLPTLAPTIKRFQTLVDFQQDDQLRRALRHLIPTAMQPSVKESASCLSPAPQS